MVKLSTVSCTVLFFLIIKMLADSEQWAVALISPLFWPVAILSGPLLR
jgi:hypothetical protein